MLSTNKVLSPNIAYKWAAIHLYRIGLSFDNINDYHRNWFHKPIIVFIINTIFITNRIICLFSDVNNEFVFELLGGFWYFQKLKKEMNVTYAHLIYPS